MTDQTANLPAERRPQLSSGGAVAAFVPQTLDELYRLGNVMSQSGLSSFKTPESASIAIMAGAELGFSPFQACQSLAVINSRAVLWGDAIPALLLSNGFKIREWLENEAPDYPLTMKAVCEITRPDGQVFTESFSVADAKEANLWGKTGPWQTARKRMMKMRARSFCARDGASDVLRGLFVAEEVQDFQPIPGEMQQTGTGMVERLKARAQPTDVDPAGFNVRTITEETNAARPKGRKKADAAPAEAVHADPVADGAIDAEVEEIPPSASEAAAAAIEDDDLPEGLKPRPTETASVQSADAGPASSASATDASSGSAEANSSSQAQPEPSADLSDEAQAGLAGGVVAQGGFSDNPDDVQEGCAAPGDLYYHTDLPEIGGDGRRAAFKDGVFFSRLTPRDDLLIYDQHAPLVSELGDQAVTMGLPSGDQAAEINADDIATLGGAIGEFWAKMQATTSWLAIKKPLLTDLNASDDFNELEDDEKDALRVKIVEFVQALKPRDPVDAAQDATYFRLWICTQHGPDGADAIDGTLRVLKREPIWQKVGEALEPIAQAHIARCRGEA